MGVIVPIEMPKSCQECPLKYRDGYGLPWFCCCESTVNSDADVSDGNNKPFTFRPEWCVLNPIQGQISSGVDMRGEQE